MLYFYEIIFDQDQNSIKSADIADCLMFKKTHLETHKNKTNELSNN